MRRTLIGLLLLATLAGCSDFPGVYKINIPQGNNISQETIDQLRPGMTTAQVRYLMGTPLVVDTFSPQRWDYIHTYKKGWDKRTQGHLSLFFIDGKLSHYSGDFKPAQLSDKPSETPHAP